MGPTVRSHSTDELAAGAARLVRKAQGRRGDDEAQRLLIRGARRLVAEAADLIHRAAFNPAQRSRVRQAGEALREAALEPKARGFWLRYAARRLDQLASF